MRRLEWLLAVLMPTALLMAGSALAEEPAFRQRAPIEVKRAATFIQLPLPMSVYTHAQQPELADLRIVDARGERVPFALLALHLFAQRGCCLREFPLRDSGVDRITFVLQVHDNDPLDVLPRAQCFQEINVNRRADENEVIHDMPLLRIEVGRLCCEK